MQYLLLIYSEEKAWSAMPKKEYEQFMGEYVEFTKSIADSGHYRGGNELDVVTKAKTVRVRNGKTLISDGPFAETKEQLGGYYLVEAQDAAEALKLAARIPSVRLGSIEVRPIVPHEMP
jgi:hypothetical protein